MNFLMTLRMNAQMTKLILLLSLLPLWLSGCATMNIEDYKDEKPSLDLFSYFDGQTFAWGQFQDRSGKVIRRFQVDIQGAVSGEKLVLDEQFDYADGEKQTRIWTIHRIAENEYQGFADDVIGSASGKSAGNALNWKYKLALPYQGSTIEVTFDDWMFLNTDKTMINRAKVTKFGFEVGQVTLFFKKPD